MKRKTYQQMKARTRDTAIAWQVYLEDHVLYMSEAAEATEYFTKLGKRYGLLREFRENGII